MAQDGQRYLYFEKGHVIEINPDGLSTVGELMNDKYDGWPYPESWDVECWCLESPKIIYRDGYYYMTSALGGTRGPATAHMAAVERSRGPLGPWEDSPHNPLIHTSSMDERWWTQGHATLIEHHDGTWWAFYHGIDSHNKSLDRRTLLLPVEWTDNGWLVILDEYSAGSLIPKPSGENVGHGISQSDDFSGNKLGFQWAIPNDQLDRLSIGNGKLVIDAHGDSPSNGVVLRLRHTNRSYQINVELEIESGAEAGILAGDSGIGLRKGNPPLHPSEKFSPKDFPWSPVFYQRGQAVRLRAKELELSLIHI